MNYKRIFKLPYRIVRASILGFKYLKNPLVIFKIPFNQEIIIILKNNEKIKIQRKKFVIYIEFFHKGYVYEKEYYIKNKLKYKVKNFDIIQEGILLERFDKMYKIKNIENKNILDIGGYKGESALFFIEENAKKIIVYEPFKENIECIKEHIKINNLEKNVFLYEKGVSNKNGIEVIKSSSKPGTSSFGMPGNKYLVEIPVESWNTILKKHEKDNIYLAKVDCEGGEGYLVDASKKLIKTIPNWIIETHSKEIEENIIELFESLGYKKELREKVNKKLYVNVWSFCKL